MELDPLCKPKHGQIYCWHCMEPMVMTWNYALVKDTFDTRDYQNVCYTYTCFNHDLITIKYSFIEHQGDPHPGYHYVIYKTLEMVTNIYSGKTWIQSTSTYNKSIGQFYSWFVFHHSVDKLMSKIQTYATFY